MGFKKGATKPISWQVKVPRGLVDRIRLIANVSGVTDDSLVTFILQEWTHRNKTLLLDDSLWVRLKKLMSGVSTTEQLK